MPKYQRTVIGSSRGSLSHSECSSPSPVTPPQSLLNLETSSFASSQLQNSLSTLPSSWLEPVSSHSTPQGSRAATLDSHSITDTVNEKDEGITTPPSKQTTPTTNPCNSIRALYDRMAEVEQDLSFKKDDILYVDDTLPQGNFGCCMAWQLDENAQKLERGQIPSKYMMEQEFYRRHSMSEAKDENSSAKTSSAAARRSFFRRKHKHKRSGSKDGKELLALDTISTDSIPFLDDSVNLAYQRVQKVDCTSPRPVLILGPLLDAVKDMLVKESPGKLCWYPLEVMKASQQAIERGVKDCLFIDYKRRSGHFDVTTVASVKEITEKDCHCLLDIAPHAIERLHSIHIYPIVIFVRYKNAKQIKEQKDSVFLRDKVTQKHSKEQFETAQKIEQEYNKYFTGIVQGGPLLIICTQIMITVDQEQNKVLWIPFS
ncbi:disks large homolog 5-like [Podarcis raffonei]|uniref:disks large homolog 5-like n=1 Tax=Podarcis raffonei TaxID=65483 RepID=UPI0023298006|nr:disks large homolog 5-like [Podarcis raffonei]